MFSRVQVGNSIGTGIAVAASIKYRALLLLRFQNVSCRSVSVGFAEKTSVFGSV